ncbi:MAG: BlaI/MecI/CopY family transcriptional regulator [Kiritimatiellae bacterium]|nr:BlaI/MecI/CopY family transcriptional regulator [Kiritimatiellia bacterium]
MGKKREGRPALSPAQMEIMNAVWARGAASTAEVWEAIKARRAVARNTVLTLLNRLVGKGWLRRKRAGHGFVYESAAERTATVGRMLDDLVDSAFEGSAAGLVMSLLDSDRVDADEAARIREAIAEHRRKERSGR